MGGETWQKGILGAVKALSSQRTPKYIADAGGAHLPRRKMPRLTNRERVGSIDEDGDEDESKNRGEERRERWATWQWLPVEEERAIGAEASPGKE